MTRTFPKNTIKQYFLVEKPGLDVTILAGHIEVVPDEE
jgi:hypothetical protein